MSWVAVLTLAAGAYLLKLVGVVAGDRFGTPLFRQAVLLMPPALFAAVIMLQTFESDTSLVLDARAWGLLAACVATWRRLPFMVIVLIAMAVTAIARLVS